MKSANNRKRNYGGIYKYIIGILTTFITTALMSLLAPIFIINEYVELQYIWLLTVALHAIATVLGGFFIDFLTEDYGNNTILAVAGIWIFLIFTIGGLAFDNCSRNIIPSVIGSLIGVGLAYFLRLSRKNGGIRRQKRRRRQ